MYDGTKQLNIKCILVLAGLVLLAGCTPEILTTEVQPGSSLSIKEQQAKNADVFNNKGQYERDSSFKRRKAKSEIADKFFMNISEDNCLVKKERPTRCFRASNDGYLRIYDDGTIESAQNWRRLNDRFCINVSCHYPDSFKIQPFSVYANLAGKDAKQDILTDVKTLREERVERIVKSMSCFRCEYGTWPSSLDNLYSESPQCAAELERHENQYGQLNINNSQTNVSETDLTYEFLSAQEVPDPKYKTTLKIKVVSVNKAEICNPSPD